jgi:iron complex transport system permease protein
VSDRNIIIVLSALLVLICLLFIAPGLTVENYQYFLSQRVPKVVAIILTGSAIAFSSVLFQTITVNRILTPTALGLDALYLLTQTLIVFLFGSTSLLVVNKNVSFLLTAAVMVLLAAVLFRLLLNRGETNLIRLVLVGAVIGQLFRSFAYFLLMIMNPNEFTALQNKLFASFNSINTGILLLATVIFFFMAIFIYRDLHRYDVISLGREHSISLGVEHDKVMRKSFLIIAILVSVATALVGPITFLGLLVANLARQTANTYKHSVILTISVLFGAIFLLGGQLAIERIFNFETTVSVIINFIGGIYFIALLLRESRI